MTMDENTQRPQPAPDPEENLVAYLDGELTEPAIREVEQQLANNPTLRRNADAYQKAWELLDELPLVQATEQFTTKTVASLKIEQLSDEEVSPTGSRVNSKPTTVLPSVKSTRNTSATLAIQTDEKPARNRRLAASAEKQTVAAWPLATWFVGLALSAIGGYLITNRLVPSDTEILLRDYPLIKNWDKYQEAGSLEFLHQYEQFSSGRSNMPTPEPKKGPQRESPSQP